MLVNKKNKSPLLLQLVIGLGIVLTLGSLAGYILIFKGSRNFGESSTQSTTTDLVKRTEVLALGRLEPAGEILAISGPSGERVSQLVVQEGSQVHTGQILAYLDSYSERLAQKNLAASQVADIHKRIENDRSLRQAEIDRAQVQVTAADTTQQQRIEAQHALIRRLQIELDDAVSLRDRFKQLWSEGAVSQRDYETKQVAVRQATETLSQAQSTLQELNNTRSTSIQTSEANLRAAEVELARVDSHSGLASAIENLKLAEAQLERTIIRAPRDGEVLKILTHAGEAITNQGLLSLGDTRQMYAVAEVYETDVNLVKVGQQVMVSSPAFDTPLSGTITHIGRIVFKQDVLGDDPAAATDARVVEVKARLNQNQVAAGLSQLQVDVRIQLNTTKVSHVSSPSQL